MPQNISRFIASILSSKHYPVFTQLTLQTSHVMYKSYITKHTSGLLAILKWQPNVNVSVTQSSTRRCADVFELLASCVGCNSHFLSGGKCWWRWQLVFRYSISCCRL